MDPTHNHSDTDHITIHITSGSDASSSSSSSSHERLPTVLDPQYIQDQSSTSSRAPIYQPQLFTGPSSRNPPPNRRGNNQPRHRSPLKSVVWISIEMVLTVSQIVAAILVMSFSRHEKPRAPLRLWIVGYASGCFVIIPLLYWRLRNRNQGSEVDSSQHLPDSSQTNGSDVPLTRRAVDEGWHWTNVISARGGQSNVLTNPRLKILIEYIKVALDCYFAVWFAVGNVWVFGGHASSNEAPKLYRLCIVFLSISCIGYALPFILCATVCCCLPCIISMVGFREELSQNRGATQDSINSLPTYKFKVRKNKGGKVKEHISNAGEGGIVAAGTEKEREISGEDAVCCICLAKYVNNDELRELPCSHFFHKSCVDKWLKINASCPLCKAEVGDNLLGSLAAAAASV